MSQNRIVFLARRAWPEIGGVELHLLNVAQRAKTLNHITIVCEQTDKSQALHQVVDGIEYYRIPINQSAPLKPQLFKWWSDHFELLKSADIIHIHDVFFWMYQFLPKLLFKKIYITFHGYEGQNPTFKQRLVHQIADLFSERNICVGGFHQKWYQIEPDNITFGATDTPSSLSVIKNDKAVFVGRLAEDTGILSYLQAMALLPKKNRPKLDVIGDGPLKAKAQYLVHHEKLPVSFFQSRFVSVKDYQQYKFACVSGYLSILNALSAGIPVLSTHSTKLKHDYLYLSPFAKWIHIGEDPHELAEGLATQKTLSYEAISWARKQTWDKLYEQYLRIWNE